MMKYTKKMTLFILLAVLLLNLSACGGQTVAEAEATAAAGEVDPVAIFTSAAATVAAQLTETALSFSPTPLPATATPTMIPPTATLVNLTLIPIATKVTLGTTPDGPICDNMEFVADITIPDGTTIKSGADFEKIWRIRNTGVCTWDDGYQLVLASGGSILDSPSVVDKIKVPIAPGEVVDIGYKWFTAPIANGKYSNCFVMQNDRGSNFGTWICVEIEVKGN
jgi:hypothetical protein